MIWAAPTTPMVPTDPAFVAAPTVAVDGVSVWFGQKVALSELSCSFGPGVTGLLGPNGAGKTTLMRAMTGLLSVSAGQVWVAGGDPRRVRAVHGHIGLVPEDEAVPNGITPRDLARYRAALHNVPDREAPDRWLAVVGLLDEADRLMDGFSKGMRQRAKVAAALVSNPTVLILDEPLNGADPRQRVHFKQLLRQLAAAGKTIVLSSHILEEVEELADTVLLIVNGKLAASGGFRAIRAALNQRPYHVRVTCDAPRRLASAVVALTSVDAVHVDPDGAVVILSRNVQDLQIELPRLARTGGISLRRVEPLDDSLESVFGYLVEG